ASGATSNRRPNTLAAASIRRGSSASSSTRRPMGARTSPGRVESGITDEATHGSLGFAWAEPRHSARMGVLPTERLEFSLLGPLAVTAEQGPVELGAPKHRALLALLLLEPGRVVSVD